MTDEPRPVMNKAEVDAFSGFTTAFLSVAMLRLIRRVETLTGDEIFEPVMQESLVSIRQAIAQQTDQLEEVRRSLLGDMSDKPVVQNLMDQFAGAMGLPDGETAKVASLNLMRDWEKRLREFYEEIREED